MTSDVGGGVARTTIEVNGTQVANDAICNPGQDGNGYVSSMTPCDQIELRPIDVETDAPPFQDGPGNAVKVCTHEFGTGAASACTTKMIKVDNEAPAAPQAIDVPGWTGLASRQRFRTELDESGPVGFSDRRGDP